MANKQKTLWAASDFLWVGLLVALVGGIIGGVVVILAPDWIGYSVAGVFGFAGQTMFSIGVVAKGVQVGRR